MPNALCYPGALVLSNGLSLPVFQFTEALRLLAPEVEWPALETPLVIMDYHLAQVFGKQTEDINRQANRNREYFKPGWRVQLSRSQWKAFSSLIKKEFQKPVTSCDQFQPVTSCDQSQPVPGGHQSQPVPGGHQFQPVPGGHQFQPVTSCDQFQPVTSCDQSQPVSGEHQFQPLDNEDLISQIFGTSLHNPFSPWFYTKPGAYLVASFTKAPAARVQAIELMVAFERFEQTLSDPAANPQAQPGSRKVFAGLWSNSREEETLPAPASGKEPLAHPSPERDRETGLALQHLCTVLGDLGTKLGMIVQQHQTALDHWGVKIGAMIQQSHAELGEKIEAVQTGLQTQIAGVEKSHAGLTAKIEGIEQKIETLLGSVQTPTPSGEVLANALGISEKVAAEFHLSPEEKQGYLVRLLRNQHFPMPEKALVLAGPRYQTLTEIAQEIGVLSLTGKPHGEVIGCILRKLELDTEEYRKSIAFERHGHLGASFQYTELVIPKIREWLESQSWPTVIQLSSGEREKTFRCQYRRL